MTFDEYKEYDGMQALHSGSVTLTKEDCYSINKVSQDKFTVCIKWDNHTYFSYLKLPNSSTLYTMDEDGNKKNPTVFRIEIE